MTAHFGYSNSGMTRRVQLPALETVGEPIDSSENWNAWAAISHSHDRTGVVGSRLGSVEAELQIDNETWAWRVFGLVMLAAIVLLFLI